MATKSDNEKQWYMATVSETCAVFEVQQKKGLNSEQVKERSTKRKKANIEAKPKTPTLPGLFWAILTILLVLSASVYELEANNAALIFTLSACLLGGFGLAQQGFVRHILLVVAKTSPPQVRVRRDGVITKISAEAIVPGDILIFSQGDFVPVSARLIELKDLLVDESAATGDSVPVAKNTFALHKKTKQEKQKNMVLAGSYITGGTGIGIAVSSPELTVTYADIAPHTLNKVQQKRYQGAILAVFGLGLTVMFWGISFFAAIGLSAVLALSTYYYASFWLQYVTWASLYDQAASNGLKFRDINGLKSFVKTDMVIINAPHDFADIAAFVHQLQAELRIEVRPLVKQTDVKKLEKELNIQDSALTNAKFMGATRAQKLKLLNEYQLFVGFDDVATTEAVSLLQQTGHHVAWIDDAPTPLFVSTIATSYISQSDSQSEFLQAKSDIAYTKQVSLKRIAVFFDVKTRFKNMTAY